MPMLIILQIKKWYLGFYRRSRRWWRWVSLWLIPDDIESITVLKGASASVLYGSQGANGVILITTKSGKSGKTRVDFSSNFTIDKAAYLPDLQFEYGSEPGALYSWGDKKSSPNFVDDFYQTGTFY